MMEASTTASTKVEAKKGTVAQPSGMATTGQLEQAVRTVLKAKQTPAERQAKLQEIYKATRLYIDRIDAKRSKPAGDPWDARTLDRLRAYLIHFAADVQDLSLQCERTSSSDNVARA